MNRVPNQVLHLLRRFEINASAEESPEEAAMAHGLHPVSLGQMNVAPRNDDRAPLLFLSGSEDHLMPPKIQRSNAKHYTSNTVTEVKEFEGPHLLPARDGWEEVADYALTWATEHAVVPSRA